MSYRPPSRRSAFVRRLVLGSCIVGSCASYDLRRAPAEEYTQARAAADLRRAVDFFRTKIGLRGGYVYQTTSDLAHREGEETVTPTQVWIQPPATPTVGEAYLAAYQACGESYLLEAARETAECLIQGQLRSGGWYVLIEFDPEARRKDFDYRVDPPGNSDKPKKRRLTTLDDDKTQACLRFLIHLDRALEFNDAAVHECVRYGLDKLVEAQYPNGAWPQQFDAPPNPAEFPVRRASYPAEWSRTFPAVNYTRHYTFNDDTIADVVHLMLEAADVYGESRYRAAAERAGDFIIAAQMPEPQPAWAQQYDANMNPAWARKFEPPSITGGESQGIVQILIDLYKSTGEERFLAPIPPALAYLRKSQLSGDRMARFYELQTNKPLYFTKQYELTYDDADVPTHYAFVVGNKVEQLQQSYDKLRAEGPPAKKPAKTERASLSKKTAAAAEEVARRLDERGAWIEDGKFDGRGTGVITSKTFVKNLQPLARYVGAR